MKIALIITASTLSIFATSASAQNMPVSTFLAKADALKAKGPLALFSSDIGVLKKEVEAAAVSYRGDRKAAIASLRLRCTQFRMHELEKQVQELLRHK